MKLGGGDYSRRFPAGLSWILGMGASDFFQLKSRPSLTTTSFQKSILSLTSGLSSSDASSLPKFKNDPDFWYRFHSTFVLPSEAKFGSPSFAKFVNDSDITFEIFWKRQKTDNQLQCDQRPVCWTKSSCSARALGVTKFRSMRCIILVTLCCAT